MKKSVVKMISDQCDAFCRKYDLPPVKRKILERLAIQSYQKASAKERGTWSLEAIVKQGL